MKNTARTFQTFRQISCSTLYFLNVWRHNRSFLSKYLEWSLELLLCARISSKLKYESNSNSLAKVSKIYLFYIIHTKGRLKTSHCTEVRFASLSFRWICYYIAVINPPEKKLANRTSVHCIESSKRINQTFSYQLLCRLY